MSNQRNSWVVFTGFIAIGLIVGVVLTTGFNIDSKTLANKPVQSSIYSESAGQSNQDSQRINPESFNPSQVFVNVVKNVRPAIVTITTTKNVKIPANPWYRLFRDFGYEDNRGNEEREIPQHGLGSGIIVSADGYILTNHHVIKEVDELTVQLVDDREYKAKIIGTDPTTEIALIKIDANDLSSAVLGNSDELQIGEWVLAIGSPLELNFTVTAGIVSALSRDINIIQGQNAPYGIENFIQTDAAINPGNSGGALVNYRGEVVGVNTAIATPTGTYVGYGFAVPINIAKTVMDDFIQYGEIRRGYLGVYIEQMDPTKAEGVGLDKPRGVFITSILKNKAADKAGIKAGDVILKVDGVEVNKPNQLQAKVSSYDPEDKISIIIWRDGKEKTVNLVLEKREDGNATVVSKNNVSEEKVHSLGMKVRDLTKNELERFDLDHGILIQSVENYSVATKEGLRPNDVIVEIDRKEVDSVSEFNKYIENITKGDIVKVQIRRKDSDGSNFDRLVFLKIPSK